MVSPRNADKPSTLVVDCRKIGNVEDCKDKIKYKGKKKVQNVMNVSLQQERYAQSLIIRKKIEAKIKSGTSTPRDLKNFQFHTNIIDEYERNNRANKKFEKPMSAEERQKMQRYKSALGIVLKYQKTKQSQMSDEERRLYIASKAIVDTYEQSNAKKGGAAQSAVAKFERTKNELIKQAKKDYPFKFVLSGAARKKKRSLMAVGIDMEEARYIALHSSTVVSDLIDLKKTLPKKVDKSKQLVAYNAPGARQQPAKAAVKQNGPNKAKPTVAAKAAPEPKKTAAEILAKKLKAGCRSAKKVLLKHENSDLDKLTDKEKAIIRISLRRLRTYNQAEGKPVETTRFDVLLNDDPKSVKETPPKATTEEVVAKAEDGGDEENVEGEVAAEEGEQECEYNPEEEVDADEGEDAAQAEEETKEE